MQKHFKSKYVKIICLFNVNVMYNSSFKIYIKLILIFIESFYNDIKYTN